MTRNVYFNKKKMTTNVIIRCYLILPPSQIIRKKKSHLLRKLKHKNLEYSFVFSLEKVS